MIRIKTLLTFILLNIVYLLYSESRVVDSLQLLINKAADKTEKVDLLNQLSIYNIDKLFNYEEAQKLAKEALDMAQKINYKPGIALAHRRQAYIFRLQGKLEEASHEGKLAMDIYKELDDKSGIAWCIRNYAILYNKKGNYEKGLELHRQALTLASETNDTYELYWNYRNLTEVQKLLGNYKLALDYLHKALIIKTVENDDIEIANLYNNFANVYHFMGDYSKARDYYQKAVKIFEEKQELSGLSWAYNNIGAVYYYQHDYEKALEYYYNALESKKQINDARGFAHIYNNIGEIKYLQQKFDEAILNYNKALQTNENKLFPLVYFNMGDVFKGKKQYQKAINYYHKSFDYAKEIGYHEFIARSQIALSRIYLSEGNLKRAQSVALEAFDITKESDNLDAFKDAAEALANTYAKSNNYKQAFEFYQLYKILYDSIYTQSSKKSIYDLEISYETEKKEKEIELLRKDAEIVEHKNQLNRIQRNIAIAGLLILLILLVMVANRLKLRQKLYKENEAKIMAEAKYREEEALRKEEELKATAEINKINADRVQEELEFRNREITSSALYVAQKNEILNQINDRLSELKDNAKAENKREITLLKRLIKENIELDEDWNNFKLHFEKVHPRFFESLTTKFPELTPNEQKICAYLQMNLSGKEIARLLNITPKSTQMSRYRLKKRFNLGADDDLIEFIKSI